MKNVQKFELTNRNRTYSSKQTESGNYVITVWVGTSSKDSFDDDYRRWKFSTDVSTINRSGYFIYCGDKVSLRHVLNKLRRGENLKSNVYHNCLPVTGDAAYYSSHETEDFSVREMVRKYGYQK